MRRPGMTRAVVSIRKSETAAVVVLVALVQLRGAQQSSTYMLFIWRVLLGRQQAAALHEQARSEAIACPARGGGRRHAARSAWNNSQRKTGERASARGGQDESGLPSPAACSPRISPRPAAKGEYKALCTLPYHSVFLCE